MIYVSYLVGVAPKHCFYRIFQRWGRPPLFFFCGCTSSQMQRCCQSDVASAGSFQFDNTSDIKKHSIHIIHFTNIVNHCFFDGSGFFLISLCSLLGTKEIHHVKLLCSLNLNRETRNKVLHVYQKFDPTTNYRGITEK